jgi:hypothetical protein
MPEYRAYTFGKTGPIGRPPGIIEAPTIERPLAGARRRQ